MTRADRSAQLDCDRELTKPDSSGLVSVIMPCYNGAAHLRESVASALRQSYRHLELVVVNDGSTDASPIILAGFNDPRVRVLHQGNRGVCAARNYGLRSARGDYIAFLDADDTWDPKCLEKLHTALTRDPGASLAYCGWQNLGLAGRRADPFLPPNYEGPGKLAFLLEECRWPIHATLTRRAAIERAGTFDERFPTSEDFLFWLRIASKERITLVPEVLAFYHHHAGQRATSDSLRMARNHWLVQREFLRQNPGVTAELGAKRVRKLTAGQLLKKGYACYWRRDLVSAQAIFRLVMKTRYGTWRDWLYMVPSLLPLPIFAATLRVVDELRPRRPS